MKTLHGIAEYLRATDEMIRGFGQRFTLNGFVLKHGRNFSPIKIPPRFECFRGPIKMCYQNAAHAALARKDLIYCEGYAASLIPVMHAWCIDRRGRVLEFTWSTPAREYYGIPFRTEFLRQQLVSNAHYGIIDAWMNDWPLLRGKFPKREWYQPLKGRK